MAVISHNMNVILRHIELESATKFYTWVTFLLFLSWPTGVDATPPRVRWAERVGLGGVGGGTLVGPGRRPPSQETGVGAMEDDGGWV